MNKVLKSVAALLAATVGASAHAQGGSGPIRIGVLAPITGPLATPGRDMVDGMKLYWEQA